MITSTINRDWKSENNTHIACAQLIEPHFAQISLAQNSPIISIIYAHRMTNALRLATNGYKCQSPSNSAPATAPQSRCISQKYYHIHARMGLSSPHDEKFTTIVHTHCTGIIRSKLCVQNHALEHPNDRAPTQLNRIARERVCCQIINSSISLHATTM